MLSDGSMHRPLLALVRQVRRVPKEGRRWCGYVFAMRIPVVSLRTMLCAATWCCAGTAMLLGTILRQLEHDGDVESRRLVAWMSTWSVDDSRDSEKSSVQVRSTGLRWIQKKSCDANRRPYSRRG
jgi:hypothetical protein